MSPRSVADTGSRTKADDPRYQRLLEATRAAAREGYDAVSMRKLADTCRLSMTTIYQFCQSKDQLIAEAHADTMRAFRERVIAKPSRAATPADRVRRAIHHFVEPLEQEPVLTHALMRAVYSLDPEVEASRSSVGAAYASIIDAAIGDSDVADRDAVIGTLGHVMDSVIVGWLSGRDDPATVRRELDRAVRVLLPAPHR